MEVIFYFVIEIVYSSYNIGPSFQSGVVLFAVRPAGYCSTGDPLMYQIRDMMWKCSDSSYNAKNIIFVLIDFRKQHSSDGSLKLVDRSIINIQITSFTFFQTTIEDGLVDLYTKDIKITMFSVYLNTVATIDQ